MPKTKKSPVNAHDSLTNSSVIATSSSDTNKAEQMNAESKRLPEQRGHMIATAAYFLAEKRGFVCGYEMHDWLTAEREIDSQLKS